MSRSKAIQRKQDPDGNEWCTREEAKKIIGCSDQCIIDNVRSGALRRWKDGARNYYNLAMVVELARQLEEKRKYRAAVDKHNDDDDDDDGCEMIDDLRAMMYGLDLKMNANRDRLAKAIMAIYAAIKDLMNDEQLASFRESMDIQGGTTDV